MRNPPAVAQVHAERVFRHGYVLRDGRFRFNR